MTDPPSPPAGRRSSPLGALVGAVVPLMLVGLFVGFFPGIYVVARRFREI